MPRKHDVRGVGFKRLTKVDRALRIFLDSFKPIQDVEIVPTKDAFQRVCAENVSSPTDLPPFNKSAVDGYALDSRSTSKASKRSPVVLRIVGESRLGRLPGFRVFMGTAARIATGASLPAGANAVVMIEDTKEVDHEVEVFKRAAKLEEVIQRGEDVRKGSRLLTRGTRISAHHAALLSAVGVKAVSVYRRLIIGVLSTGSELDDVGGPSGPGRSFDANRPALLDLVKQLGAVPYDLGISSDDEGQLARKLSYAIKNLDGMVITAGSSVGRADLVPRVVNSLGKPGMLVHGIAMRPAMPTGLAVLRGKPVASLPGFPVSAIISFMVFVEPAIRKLMNAPAQSRPRLKAKLTSRVRGVRGMRTYVRVKVRPSQRGFTAEPLKFRAAGSLSSLTTANGLVIVPEESEGFFKGDEVEVELFRSTYE